MTSPHVEQFLLLSLADKKFALQINCALEIIDPMQSKIAAFDSSEIPDRIIWEKSEIPVIDTRRVINNDDNETLRNGIAVVTEIANEKAALIVDSADQILRVEPGAIKNIGTQSEFFESQIETEDQNIPILNLDKVYKLSGAFS